MRVTIFLIKFTRTVQNVIHYQEKHGKCFDLNQIAIALPITEGTSIRLRLLHF